MSTVDDDLQRLRCSTHLYIQELYLASYEVRERWALHKHREGEKEERETSCRVLDGAATVSIDAGELGRFGLFDCVIRATSLLVWRTMLDLRSSSSYRIMAGRASLLTLSSDSIQVHRRHRAHPFSSALFQGQKLCKADTTGWSTCSRITVYMLPWRTGRTSTLQVYAAKQGFGSQPKKKTKKAGRLLQKKEEVDPVTQAQQILARKEQNLKQDAGSTTVADKAPGLLVNEDMQSNDPLDEELFERRLAEIKQAAVEQKVLAEQKKYGPIDYDAPLPSTSNVFTDNLGAKIGIGLAVVVFGLIFALGDFLPSQSPTTEKSSLVETKQLTKEESSKLQAQVQEFEDILKNSPGDRNALEGAAVSYAELGEYDKAIQYLSKIIQKSRGDAEVLRVLAEVQNGKGDYDSSIFSYRAAIRASSKKESFTLLQGLVDTLLASKKPSEAVGELLAARARLSYNFEQIKSNAKQALLPPTLDGDSAPGKLPGDSNVVSEADEQIDPITLELLLAKAYAAWDGHTSDAVSVYDGLIKTYPEDYRGYLAKAVLLKGQNKGGDAERMFIQARYLAPPNSKSIVDIYSGRRPSS